MSKIEVSIEPHYMSNLIGSLFTSVDIKKGLELNPNDMFGSFKWFSLLNDMYSGWVEYTQFSIPTKYERQVTDSLGLMVPLMDLSTGHLAPSNTNIEDLKSLISKFITEIEQEEDQNCLKQNTWLFYTVDFNLRKGKTSWTKVKELLLNIIPVIEWYHKEFYLNFWKNKEYAFYSVYVERFQSIEFFNKLGRGIDLLQQWITDNDIKHIDISLNRFMGSFNPKIKYNSGKGLPENIVHVSPENNLEFIIHEISHIFQGYPTKYSSSETIKRIAKEMIPYTGITKSPVDTWSIQEVVQFEIDEIVTEYLTSQVIQRIDPNIEVINSYCKNEPFLIPLFDRLQKFNNLLGKESFLDVLHLAFDNWNYKTTQKSENEY